MKFSILQGVAFGTLVYWLIQISFYDASVHFSWMLQDPLSAVLLCLIYPITEEFLFRGVIQGYLLNHRLGPMSKLGISVANIVTTILFFTLHWIGRSLTVASWVIGPSLILGVVREKTDSLVAPMLVHIVWNVSWYSLIVT